MTVTKDALNKRSKTFRTILYVLALLIFQEVALRIAFPIPEVKNFDRINHMMLAKYFGQYRHLRNQNWHWQSLPDTGITFLHDMNQYGFRDEEWPVTKKEGKSRVLFVGDSFVEGIMATKDETIPAGFESAAENENLEVWNGGMMGTGVNSYMLMASDALATFDIDHVIFCISSNDLSQKTPIVPEYHLTPEFFNPFLPRFIELLKQIRDDTPVKFRWDESSKSYFPPVTSKSNPWNTNAKNLEGEATLRLEKAMKNGGISPFRTNNLFFESINLGKVPELGDMIPYMQFICNKFKAKLTVVYIPTRSILTDYYYTFDKEFCQTKCPDSLDLTTPEYKIHALILGEECKRIGVPFIDLTPIAEAEEKKGNHIYWNYDEHMRGKGYLLMGKHIYRQWDKFY